LKFDLTLGLADRPGQLLKALDPIAKNGGNIISIIHEREKPAEGFVPVSLVVDFPSKINLKETIEDLKAMDIGIIKSEEIIETTRVTLILIGKIDLRKLIETKFENTRTTGFEVSAPDSKDACVKLDLEVPIGLVERVISELKRVSKEENAILISSV
jgi:ACT domain-containing protein